MSGNSPTEYLGSQAPNTCLTQSSSIVHFFLKRFKVIFYAELVILFGYFVMEILKSEW